VFATLLQWPHTKLTHPDFCLLAIMNQHVYINSITKGMSNSL